MKDVPTQPAKGIEQAAVLERGSYKDLLVYKGNDDFLQELGFVNGQWSMVNNHLVIEKFTIHHSPFTIATSSVRRKAQWLNRYPNHHHG
jgi:hydroxymethylbilane synthase